MELVKSIVELWNNLNADLSYAITFGISVLAFTFMYYYLMKFLISNNSGRLIAIIIAITVVFGGVLLLNPMISNGMFVIVPFLTVLIVISLYAVEIKRLIWKRNNVRHNPSAKGEEDVDEEKIENCISEIIKALQDMSKNDVGAIIVLSSANIPSQILDSGVKMDSDISSELIESVFFPKTPLHDGAMILNGVKIVAAGCFLPLSQQNNIPKDLGTRHRAGLGITENIDVVSLIVSEETGIISVAKAGKITRYADTQLLTKTLKGYYWEEFLSTRK